MTLESLSRDVYTCPAAFVFFTQFLLSPLFARPPEPKSVPETRCPLPPHRRLLLQGVFLALPGNDHLSSICAAKLLVDVDHTETLAG